MQSISKLAEEINSIARQIQANPLPEARITLGKLFSKLRDRVPKETKTSFRDYCREHIRKRDGEPFSHVTILNYLRFANSPAKFKKAQDWRKRYDEKRNRMFHAFTSVDPEAMYDRLVIAWKSSNEAVQKKFLADYNLARKR